MFAELLITIIFRLLNFVALMALFAYIFKKYLRKDIEESIEHDRLAEVNLNIRIGEMKHRSSEISEEIIKQQKLCEYLNARTNQWKTAFEKDVKRRRDQQKALDMQMTEHARQQVQAIAQERMVQAVLPKALAAAHDRLKKSFEAPDHGSVFVHNILAQMKKSS